MKRFIYGVITTIIIALLLLGLPLIAGYIANEFPAPKLDPNGVFSWISVHHIAQAFMFIPIILIVKIMKPNLNFGFNLGNKKRGLRYVYKFTLFFLLYTIISFSVVLLTNTFNTYNFPLNTKNIFGYLGFQLLLSGPSEEILFRSFGITVIAIFFQKRIFNGKVSVANIIAGVIFGLAHIGIFFTPFSISFNIVQVVYALVLGIIYGDAYEKTGSVIYPMMIHSISNVIAVGTTMFITILM